MHKICWFKIVYHRDSRKFQFTQNFKEITHKRTHSHNDELYHFTKDTFRYNQLKWQIANGWIESIAIWNTIEIRIVIWIIVRLKRIKSIAALLNSTPLFTDRNGLFTPFSIWIIEKNYYGFAVFCAVFFTPQPISLYLFTICVLLSLWFALQFNQMSFCQTQIFFYIAINTIGMKRFIRAPIFTNWYFIRARNLCQNILQLNRSCMMKMYFNRK